MSAHTPDKDFPSLTLKSVKAEIDNITAQLYRNSKAVAETGRRVLNMESGDRTKSHGRISDHTSRIRDSADSDDEDSEAAGNHGAAVANEDLVQLVTELQGQLDLLDSRSVRRSANAFAAQDSDLIAPLPGNDGYIPGESPVPTTTSSEVDEEESTLPKNAFPKTIKGFTSLPKKDVEAWLQYYELLPPDEAELRDLLSQAAGSSQNSEKEEAAKNNVASSTSDLLSEEEANTHFDILARFLGLRVRKSADVW